jgi:DNA-binding SARP family transcriptional activator
MAGGRLGFGVLGTLQITVDGAAVPVGAPKQRATLATMLINRNRAVSMDALIEAVWEDAANDGARASVHTYMSSLRRIIAAGGADAQRVLANAAPGYRLTVADPDCDVGRFTAAKTAGIFAAAAGRFEQACAHLTDALAQWRGPVLDDLRDYRLVDAFAAALVEDKLVAHTARAEAEIACGRAYSVLGELEALVAEHPFQEPLWAQLITAYYVAERQADALNAYRRLQATLTDELGVDPGQKLRDLHQRILRQEPLDTGQAARNTARETLKVRGGSDPEACPPLVARLREPSGVVHDVSEAVTRIGRSSDNDIVLSADDVSRRHAVIIATGNSFVIVDARSANGVEVDHRRILGSATLTDGSVLGIGDYQFAVEIGGQPPVPVQEH